MRNVLLPRNKASYIQVYTREVRDKAMEEARKDYDIISREASINMLQSADFSCMFETACTYLRTTIKTFSFSDKPGRWGSTNESRQTSC